MSRWADSLIEEEPAQYSLIFKLHPHFLLQELPPNITWFDIFRGSTNGRNPGRCSSREGELVMGRLWQRSSPETDLRLIIQMNGESKNYRDESRFPKVILMNPDRGSRYSANELPSL